MVGGCATHPLPEDFSRKSTRDLVQAVRCELAQGVASLPDATPKELRNSVAGIDFKLNMNEETSATAGKLALTDPVSGGSFSLDLTGSSEKYRNNERKFRIIDTFEKLEEISRSEQCNQEFQRANFVYPIAGRIGLDEIVTTFWDVNSLSTLNPVEKQSAFSDKIVFKTKLSAGLNPSLTLSTRAAGLHLTNLSVDGVAVREDIHQLTISMDLENPKRNAVNPNKARSQAPTEQKTLLKNVPVAPYVDDGPAIMPSGRGSSSAVDNVIRELNYQRQLDDLRSLPVLPLR